MNDIVTFAMFLLYFKIIMCCIYLVFNLTGADKSKFCGKKSRWIPDNLFTFLTYSKLIFTQNCRKETNNINLWNSEHKLFFTLLLSHNRKYHFDFVGFEVIQLRLITAKDTEQKQQESDRSIVMTRIWWSNLISLDPNDLELES